jgi:NADH dehydrogenase [ubiquinone] 1 alpha subcomplex assembly factor 7
MMATPLGETIAAIIAQDGPITLARYMSLALGHPRHGYYVTRDPLGAAGDFITAPEISQMFGELLGLWAAHAWVVAGSPKRVALVELGPGRGTLMADALRAIARAAPVFAQSLHVHLVETSPALRAAQRATLAASAEPQWHDGVETLPEGPIIVIANEFFDALPIRQFIRAGGAWRERLVGLGEGQLTLGLSAEAMQEDTLPDAPDGSVLEVCEPAAAIMAQLARRIARESGAALVIDYGHLQSAFGSTFQAVEAHRFVDPLARPGEADLTAHVDFGALARAAEAEGARIDLMTGQADFLEALGIRQRASALAARSSPEQLGAIEAALDRLTDRSPTGMGSLFKVMAVSGG